MILIKARPRQTDAGTTRGTLLLSFRFSEDMSARELGLALLDWADRNPKHAYPVTVNRSRAQPGRPVGWTMEFIDPDERPKFEAFDWQP